MNKKIAIGGIAVVALVIAAAILLDTSNKKKENGDSKIALGDPNGADFKDYSKPEVDPKKDMVNLRKVMNARSLEHWGSPEAKDDKEAELTVEEQNRRNEIVGDRLHELGPRALDILMQEQAPDSAWTDELADKGKVFLKNEYEGTAIHSVDCKELVCRIELKHKDDKSSKVFLDTDGGAKGPWGGMRQFGLNKETNGEYLSILYIERDKAMTTFKKMDDVMWTLIQKEKGEP